MSVVLVVFLPSETLPSVDQWQHQIDELGVDLKLSDAVETMDHSGYLPAVLGGRPSGFEFYFGSITDSLDGAPPVQVGDCKSSAELVTHSDIRELKSAMIAAAALASLSNGFIFDDQTDSVVSIEHVLTEALAIEI